VECPLFPLRRLDPRSPARQREAKKKLTILKRVPPELVEMVVRTDVSPN
jgi:hypothetical protein